MTTLTPAQVYQYARGGGFSPADAVTMTAIAGAESGYNPQAHNPTPPDDSYGLWQINMLGAMGPQRRAQLGITSNAALYDPATNARAAYMIFRGQGLRAWSTYTNGSYRANLPSAQSAAKGSPGSIAPSAGTVSGTSGSPSVSGAAWSSSCAWGFDLPVVGQTCILTNGQLAVIKAGMFMGAAATLGIFGLLVLAAYGFKSSGAMKAAGSATKAVGAGVSLVAPAVGVPVAAAGEVAKRAGRSKKDRQDQRKSAA